MTRPVRPRNASRLTATSTVMAPRSSDLRWRHTLILLSEELEVRRRDGGDGDVPGRVTDRPGGREGEGALADPGVGAAGAGRAEGEPQRGAGDRQGGVVEGHRPVV